MNGKEKDVFRFLIVEDVEDTLEIMRDRLAREFLGSQVDTASTVVEARRRIHEATSKERPYQVAVLDFKLPREAGGYPEIHDELCPLFRDTMPDALVVHITAFDEDKVIRQHVDRIHMDPLQPSPAAMVSKREITWPAKTLRIMKAYLYGTIISEHLDDLFSGARGLALVTPGVAARGGMHTAHGTTHALATVRHEIEAYWGDLDDRLKDRIRHIFDVDESRQPIGINLL